MSKKIKIIGAIIVVILAGIIFWQVNKNRGVEGVDGIFNSVTEESGLPENIQEAYSNFKEDPTNIDSYVTIARWKADKGQIEDAIKLYLAALEIRPVDTLLLHNLADIYIKQKRYIEAEELYLKIIENNPGWISAYRSLVDLYRYQMPEKHTELPEILEYAMKVNLAHMRVHFVQLLAVYRRDYGPKEEAIKWYEELVKLEPTNDMAKKELEELKK